MLLPLNIQVDILLLKFLKVLQYLHQVYNQMCHHLYYQTVRQENHLVNLVICLLRYQCIIQANQDFTNLIYRECLWYCNQTYWE
jgi:hypothetical protein